MQLAASETTDRDHRSLTYKPALDGIRALAVAAVLCYHAGFGWAKGGFLGVDAFFVLSGYLITSILLAEWNATGGIGLLTFWTRRARRLLPALFLMLIGVAFYALTMASQLEMDKIRADAIATIAYVANWRQVFAGQSYFDQFTLPSPLRHTWSLAIEEQYYLVWPLLLLGLLRLPLEKVGLPRFSPRRLLGVTVALAAASALLMALLFHPGGDPSRVYYGTDTRAQSLLIGSSLAILLGQLGPVRDGFMRWMLDMAAVECAIAVCWVWVHASGNDAFLYRGGFLLLALGVAVVITAAVQPEGGVVGRALSLPPLRWLGLISYGVYLWHWPIYLMLTPARTGLTGWDGYQVFLVRVVATLAVATASYHFLEMPIRRGAFRYRKVAWTFAPSGALALGVVLVLVTRVSMPPMPQMQQVEGMTLMRDAVPTQAVDLPPLKVMIVGDSEGYSMLPGLRQVAAEDNVILKDVVGTGCGSLDLDRAPDPNSQDPQNNRSQAVADTCRGWHATWPGEVSAFQPDVVLWVFGPWDGFNLEANGQLLESGSPGWHDFLMSGLEKNLAVFTAQGASKFIILTYPYYRPPVWDQLPNADQLEHDAWQRIYDVNQVYWEFAAAHPDKVAIIDLNHFVCPEGKYSDIEMDGVKLRLDGGHFTPAGSVPVAKWLVPQVLAVVGRGDAASDSP